ncbi:MAG: 6-pyruvoyl-tetrahydropterin synthase-related protein [Candidatus Daviesbacteria bacterium]|nr:6-pyruvoyl-tetrahydropterin synthase-related protein [Candidatus Daviesbacteria bacterium]
MYKIIGSHKEFIIGLLLTLSLLWPLFTAPYFTHHDDVQVIRIYEMDKCIKDHQIPCRWVPDLGGLYGYPIFNYYAPLPYYFGELVYLFTNNLLISAKAMFIISFLGSYVFMYLLASKLWGKKGGSLAAVFFEFAPYHALDFYVRGAMGELWGLMLFPAIFWALIRLEEKINILRLLLLAISIAALVVSHNLSALIFLPLVLIWAAIIFFRRKNAKFLWFSLGGIILAVALSSFYLFPALFEKNFVHLGTTIGGYFSYTEHFKGFRKLFLDRSWGYDSSIREVPGGEKDGLSYQIGWVHLAGWILSLVAAKILWKKNKNLSIIIGFSSFVILLSIFMINPRSEFVWKLIDPLKYLQFPWRFLLLVVFFISFVSGSIFLADFKRKNVLWAFLIIAVVVFNFSYFRPAKFIKTNDEKRLSGKDWDTQIKRSIFDYLPIYAKEPPAELATSRYQILTGDSRIFDFQEGTNWITFKTQTQTHTIIRLSQYYFPDWKVFVDQKEVKVEYKNNSLGLMTIILGKGSHEITARLYDTQIRCLSNFITLIGFAVSAILFLISFQRVRRWMSYYRKRMN